MRPHALCTSCRVAVPIGGSKPGNILDCEHCGEAFPLTAQSERVELPEPPPWIGARHHYPAPEGGSAYRGGATRVAGEVRIWQQPHEDQWVAQIFIGGMGLLVLAGAVSMVVMACSNPQFGALEVLFIVAALAPLALAYGLFSLALSEPVQIVVDERGVHRFTRSKLPLPAFLSRRAPHRRGDVLEVRLTRENVRRQERSASSSPYNYVLSLGLSRGKPRLLWTSTRGDDVVYGARVLCQALGLPPPEKPNWDSWETSLREP